MYLKKTKRIGILEKYRDFIPTVCLSLILVFVVALFTRLGSIIPKEEYVIFYEGSKIADVSTHKKNIREIAEEVLLQEKKIKLTNQDIVLEQKQQGENLIKIQKGFSFKIDFFGQEKEISAVEGESVSDLLEREKFKLEENVFVDPVMETKIQKDLKVRIKKVELKQEEIKEVSVPFNVREEPSLEKKEGERVLKQKGKEGLKKTYKMKIYENGKLVGEEQKEEILAPVEDEVYFIGKKKIISKKELKQEQLNRSKKEKKVALNNHPSQNSNNVSPQNLNNASLQKYKKVLSGVATAYPAKGRTARMGPARPGIVAVDPKVIPLGTRLFIPGYGHCVAGDICGAARKGKVLIDLCMPTEAACRQFGRRRVPVYFC